MIILYIAPEVSSCLGPVFQLSLKISSPVSSIKVIKSLKLNAHSTQRGEVK